MVYDHSLDRASSNRLLIRSPFFIPSQKRKLREVALAAGRYIRPQVAARCCSTAFFHGVTISGVELTAATPAGYHRVFIIHQWTRGVAFRNDIAAAAPPGSQDTATARLRRRTSVARAPSGRPATWAAIMGERDDCFSVSSSKISLEIFAASYIFFFINVDLFNTQKN